MTHFEQSNDTEEQLSETEFKFLSYYHALSLLCHLEEHIKSFTFADNQLHSQMKHLVPLLEQYTQTLITDLMLDLDEETFNKLMEKHENAFTDLDQHIFKDSVS